METRQLTTDEIKLIAAEVIAVTNMQQDFSSDAMDLISHRSMSNIEIIGYTGFHCTRDSYFISVKEARPLIQLVSIFKELETYHSQFVEMPPDSLGQPAYDSSFYTHTKYSLLVEGCKKGTSDLKVEMVENFLIEPYVMLEDFRKAVELQEAITTAAMLHKIFVLLPKDPTVLDNVHSRFKELARKIGRLNRRDKEAKATSK